MVSRGFVEEIGEAVRASGEAWARGDITALEDLIAEQYVHTDVIGRVRHKTEWLEHLSSRRAPMTLAFDEVATTVYGEVAVVTGRNIIKNRAHEEAERQLRFTQVWIRRQGAWQRLAYHASFIETG